MAWRLRLDFYTGRDLLHSKGHVDEFQTFGPLEAVLDDSGLDLGLRV